MGGFDTIGRFFGLGSGPLSPEEAAAEQANYTAQIQQGLAKKKEIMITKSAEAGAGNPSSSNHAENVLRSRGLAPPAQQQESMVITAEPMDITPLEQFNIK
jgi:hypothetical protein